MTSPIVLVSPEELTGLIERAVRAALRDAAPAEVLVSVPEAARRLGVCTRTLRRRIRDGEVRVVRVGRSVRVDPRSLTGPDDAEVAKLAAQVRRGAR